MKKIGIHIGYWPKGNIRFEKKYINGQLNGQQNQWHDNGTLANLSNYATGKENGLQKGWRKNGDLRYNYQMVNALEHVFCYLENLYTLSQI